MLKSIFQSWRGLRRLGASALRGLRKPRTLVSSAGTTGGGLPTGSKMAPRHTAAQPTEGRDEGGRGMPAHGDVAPSVSEEQREGFKLFSVSL